MAEEYDAAMVALLELIWGQGFLAPGGAAYVKEHLAGIDLKGKRVLDLGSGLGGGDLVMAGELGAKVVGIDIEQPLIDQARRYAAAAGLADRVTYVKVTPGPFPFGEGEFDLVYSSGAITQIEGKRAIFQEIKRVLKPGGRFVCYDWMKSPGPLSPDMLYFYKMEGLTYAMDTLDAHGKLLKEVGFAEVQLEDCHAWYQKEAHREYELLKGPLNARMVELLGQEKADHYIEDWRSLLVVLDKGEMRPGRYKARKPA